MTNFHLSLKELEALANFGRGDLTGAQLLTLLDAGKRARGWLTEFCERPTPKPMETA